MKATDRLALLTLTAISTLGFVKLRALPTYTDEGVHLWWVQRVVEAGDWLRPLNVGKPFEAWLAAPFVRLGDPLTVMRSLHVIAGIISVLLTYWLATRITTRRAAWISAALTAVCPFVVYLERMTLVEIYLCAAGLFTLWSVLRFWQKPTWDAAVMIGAGLVVAAFSKFPIGFLFIAALPLAYICALREERAQLSNAQARRKWLIAYIPVLVLLCAVVVVAVVRTRQGQTPGFGLSLLEAQTQPTQPVAAVRANIPRLVDELVVQLTWPVVLLAVAGLLVTLVQGNRYQRWLTLMGAAPMMGIVLLAKDWGSHYLLFTIPPLIVSAVSGWEQWRPQDARLKMALATVALAVCTILMGYQSVLLIVDPSSARWSADGKWALVTGWPSGYGMAEMANYLQFDPQAPPVVYTLEVATAMQLRSYLPPERAARVQQIHVVNGTALGMDERQAILLSKSPAWLVTPEAVDPNGDFAAHLKRITGFSKPQSNVQVTLYEVMTP